MKKILIGLILMVCSLANAQYRNYCNSGFGFCVPIPSNFRGLGESAKGNGQAFKSPDGRSEIRAYGSNVASGANSLQENYNRYLRSKNVEYKFFKGNYFVVSGRESNGDVFYIKKALKKGKYSGEGNYLQTFMIKYPYSQSAKYDPFCKVISKSL